MLTRQTADPEGMLRFVLSPDSAVVPDLKRKLPGRGGWLLLSRAVVEGAIKKKVFAKGFKQQVKVDESLSQTIESLLHKAALENLGLANKAGALILGFEAVRQALEEKDIAALVHAHEAASDGREKLGAKAKAMADVRQSEIKIWDGLQGSDLDRILGRSNVMHFCVERKAGAVSFLKAMMRLHCYKTSAL